MAQAKAASTSVPVPGAAEVASKVSVEVQTRLMQSCATFCRSLCKPPSGIQPQHLLLSGIITYMKRRRSTRSTAPAVSVMTELWTNRVHCQVLQRYLAPAGKSFPMLHPTLATRLIA